MNEIKQYLQDVAALECQANTQDRLIAQINYRASLLGRPQAFREPVLETDLYGVSWVALLISWMLGVIVWFFIFFCILPEGYFKNASDFKEYFWLLLPFWLGIPLFLLPYRALRRKYEKHNNMRIYKEKLAKHNSLVENDNLRVSQELAVKNELKNQTFQVTQEKKHTQNALNQIYAVGIIHPKYRNLVAVASFYDYFDTGRCNTLTGPNGAYAIYEEELRFQRIESRLDVIITKLDEIIDNQQYLGELVRDANDTLHRIEQTNNRMMKSMKSISKNAELTAYNSRCSARSAEVMEHISVYNFLRQK